MSASVRSREWIRPETYPVAGVDEVGRGPLAGPVVAAAVILPLDFELGGVDDSKKLDRTTRERLDQQIRKSAQYSIGVASHAEIDQVNILQATFLAMRRAVEGLPDRPTELWIDGDKVPPGLGIPATSLVKGDSLHLSIAAASIIAKVYRDNLMEEAGSLYPGYGFERHFGYATAEHYDGIEKLGPCPIHRLSFAPFKTVAPHSDQLCLILDT